ncbi:MAG: 2-hydroxyacyl-CoA dehydratase, partial [Clostridia bacterium]|nr:2-hydroxyacyl-CoA dehydratase [Clostridia bacterium]
METLNRVEFTKEMKKDYTILAPNMAPIHFKLFENLFEAYGYHAVVLQTRGQRIVDEGLKYVHNDTCYPALLTIGQMMDALHSGEYDLNKTALMITQTGGGCRASNYIHLLRKALQKDGLGHIPVISLNVSGLEKNSGFKLTLPMIRKALAILAYGDLLMLLHNQTRPYEKELGASRALVDSWTERLTALFKEEKGYSGKEMERLLPEIAEDFARVPVTGEKKIRVGVVGEIYVKYSPIGNNDLEEFLYTQGCETMVPGLIGFMLFKVDNRIEDINLYGGSKAKHEVVKVLFDYLVGIESRVIKAVEHANTINNRFTVPSSYAHLKKLVDGVIGYGCKMGEGWLLTAEMLEL